LARKHSAGTFLASRPHLVVDLVWDVDDAGTAADVIAALEAEFYVRSVSRP